MAAVLLIPALILAYLIGSIPTAYWLARVWKGIDIRRVGSGNVGATNMLRAAGPFASLLVFLLDVLKGVLAVELTRRLAGASWALALAGIAVVAGHDWSFLLHFNSGKGVSTSFGVMLAVAPPAAAVALGVFLSVVLLSRYVSLGSLLAALSLPIFLWASGAPAYLLFLGTAMFALVALRHRANLQRLWAGTEHRVRLNRPT